MKTSIRKDGLGDPILAEAIRRIVAAYRPRRVYLFGSRAWGEPGRDSDYDLLVVMDEVGDERRLAGQMLLALWGLSASFDVIVRSQSWWDNWKDTPCSLEERIDSEGVVIHDAG